MAATDWLQLLVAGITQGAIFSLIALGFVTIYRTSRVVNMAQGSFVMLGALFAFSFLNELGWPFWFSGLVAIAGVVLVGVAMYQVVLRPIMEVSLVAMILATIGVSILLENLALLKWGGYGKGLPPFTGQTSLWIGGVAIPPQTLWILGIMPRFELKPHHGGISVPDLDASIAWYRDMLGFTVDLVMDIPADTGRLAMLKNGDFRGEFFEVPGAAPLPDDRRYVDRDIRTHGMKHMAYVVRDVEALIGELRARGVDISSGTCRSTAA
jgi:catechol 2,3-dioxygenase-like lactoylglutathione lyase family enzyme